MRTKIFVNLTTKNLEAAKAFFVGLGFTINPQFTNQDAACVVISDEIYSMIVTEKFFTRFTPKALVDAHKATETLNCLTAESKEKVDEMLTKALSMGATENIVTDMQQGEFMYGRSFNDLDGHIWEVMWMDPRTVK